MHLFRMLRESENATAEDYAKILAENVVFHTPVLVKAPANGTLSHLY